MTDQTNELIKKAASQLLNSKHAIALTGAGISTESGIPDFRGPEGVWTKNPGAEERAYKAYEKFMENPKSWWEETLTGPEDPLKEWRKAQPNPGHFALAEMEKMGLLKHTITQNIDGLHEKAGTQNLYEYHGSTFKFRCISCHRRYQLEEYNLEQMLANNQLPPRCKSCGDPIKSDIVFFGEPIPADVAQSSEMEAEKCDLMLICGTSAVVYPFAGLPQIARFGVSSQLFGFLQPKQQGSDVIIIEINAEPTPLTKDGISDYLICGKTGDILPRIVNAIKN